MQMQMLKIVVVLLIAGSGDARPQKSGADSEARAEVFEASNAGWRGIRTSDKSHDIVRDDSSRPPNNTKRDLKDLQYMDQSLRTVATQLLNVTNPQDVVKMDTKEFTKVEHGVATTQKNDMSSLIKEVNSEISNMENMGVSFGRPINSKFSYFETSHPGEAMALTEEELEREMSTTRVITAYKNQPTTTGGISTWILLNPPSTTVKSVETKLKQPFQTEVRLTVRPSSSINKIEETVSQPEKIEEKTTPQLTSVITTEKVAVITKKPTSSTTIKKVITTSTLKPEKITQNLETIESSSSTTPKATRATTVSTSTETNNAGTASPTMAPTTKKNQAPRTTSKPKATTPRTALKSGTKPTRAGQQGRPKPATTKRTTVKPETAKNETTTSTGKIEKVTFKPVPIITTPQNKAENTERPIFVTKIKASMLLDTQKTPTTLLPAPTETTTLSSSTTSNLSGAGLMEVPVKSKPIGTKPSNILKVQLKTPVDETAQIEIQPIKVNASIFKIEKVDKVKIDKIAEKDTDDLNNSPLDLKFDFNPELTRISVETQTEAATTSTMTSTTTAESTTTKRPRHNSKRKKNKSRRRKRPSSAAPSSTTVSTAAPALMEITESITDASIEDNAVQESKIAPETKVTAANGTKNKKKQPQKGISTQIYNFLSREVMPSFGMMSLVGLGLGLASYFLYPFGGTISRRNYEVEPNYKYNMDEYGGNYGQSEEEVLSKVFQGMTNHENKYPGTKDLSGGYYHYQHYDGAYDGAQTTKKIDARYPAAAPVSSASPIYRTAENTQSGVKYRNTDFRYPETQTTPVYYDRKHPDLAEAPNSANRQIVVGNVPKEYAYDVKAAAVPIDSKKGVGYVSTEVGQTQFERDIAQSFNFSPNSAGGVHSYGGPLEATTGRPDDGYEEIEITPTAVAVEHGPRSLKVERVAVHTDGGDRHSRSKRESVIQVIPSKHELQLEREEEEKEEDLSNEILDIIDLALPGGQATKQSGENNEVGDMDVHRRKHEEQADTQHAKESTTASTLITVKHVDGTTNVPENADFPSQTSGIKTSDESSSTPSGNSDSTETHSTTSSSSKDAEATTVEWFESSTTKKPAEGFSLYNFVKKVAEIKFRLGLTILKHASEGFARYLGHVQKRINGEE